MSRALIFHFRKKKIVSGQPVEKYWFDLQRDIIIAVLGEHDVQWIQQENCSSILFQIQEKGRTLHRSQCLQLPGNCTWKFYQKSQGVMNNETLLQTMHQWRTHQTHWVQY